MAPRHETGVWLKPAGSRARPGAAAPWIEFRVEAPAPAEEDLAASLCGAGAVGVHVEPGPARAPEGPHVILHAFFDRADPAATPEAIERLLGEPLARGARLLGAAPVWDGRWAERWVASLAPFPVGARFTVVPVEDPAGARPGAFAPDRLSMEGKLLLPICPSRAFGTGEHPTTQMCLEAIEEIDARGRSFLDVGTGSGILAMAAASLGARPVVAVDTDPEAVRVARANAALLPAAGCVRFACGGTGCVAGGAFSAVAANLNAVALEALGEDLVSLLAPGGVLILSGILEGEAPAVIRRIEEIGAPLVRKRLRSGWACAVHGRSDA